MTLEIAGFLSEGGPRTTFFVPTRRKDSSMNRRSRLLLTGLLLLLAAGGYSQSSQRSAGAHTSVALVADVRSVKPGLPFTAGILMTMDPGWHTYWNNPGESGLATSVEWSLPQGVSAGEIGWPLPEKTIESGDVLTYGYSHENMLLVRITPSPDLKPGLRLTLKANVGWLECEKTCVPGDASVELMLPVSGDDPTCRPRPPLSEVSGPHPSTMGCGRRFRDLSEGREWGGGAAAHCEGWQCFRHIGRRNAGFLSWSGGQADVGSGASEGGRLGGRAGYSHLVLAACRGRCGCAWRDRVPIRWGRTPWCGV